MSAPAAESRAEWLISRNSYLGGTDVAALVGKNKWKTPLMVYESKLGLTPEVGVAEAAEVGLILEPLIRQWYTADTGVPVLIAPAHLRHPKYDFLGANPDGFLGDRGVLEIKTHGIRTADDWGMENTDEVPDAYHIQATWYCGIAGRDWWDMIAVDTGTWKRRHYHGAFDADLFASLVEIARSFWVNHIEAKVPPAATGTIREMESMRRVWPNSTGEVALADSELDRIAEQYIEVSQEVTRLDKLKDQYKAQMMAAMEDASYLETRVGRFSYLTGKEKEVTNWKQVAEHALDGRKNALQIIGMYTTTESGSRRFTAPRSKK